MKSVFADTFYWIALTDPDDPAFQPAMEMERRLSRTIVVTTDEVLTEYLAFFAKSRLFRIHALRTVRRLLRDPMVHIIPQDRSSFLTALDLYGDRPDKGYSLTDCISMHTMRRLGLTDALTNDRHFEQEGFRALFRS